MVILLAAVMSRSHLFISHGFLHFSTDQLVKQRKLPFHLYKHFSFPQHVHLDGDDVPDRPRLCTQFSQPNDLENGQVNGILVVPKTLGYTVDSESQTQVDISWDVKQCQDQNLSKVYYQVQIRQSTDSEWQNLSERRIPVIRLYSTDEVVVLDKRRWKFRDGAVTWQLRVRALIKDNINNVNNPWSETIIVNIKGFSSKVNPKFVSDKKGSILY